jgi:hypothetical protein
MSTDLIPNNWQSIYKHLKIQNYSNYLKKNKK